MARCAECGYENNPRYQFCGMCGIILSKAAANQKPAADEEAPAPVSGPSFLGLDSDPQRDASYLLEEEPEVRHGHGKMLFALLLLALAGVLLTLHWRRDGYPWESPAERQARQNAGKPVAAAPDASQLPVNSTTPPQMSPLAAAPPGSAEPSTPENPAEQKPAPLEPVAETKTITHKVTEPAAIQPAVTSADSEEQLVAMGQKYLNGDGVPQDCGKAQKNLLTAGFRSNVKAQSLLGTMYATGRCVPRDLPTAYRWFARALHEEPENTRVASDLDALWRQMSPAEKKAALRAE
ncbi:MAG: SEL1-like repeat protein [Acidobacteria bacterium]|nr:SEL1-like repeat protein [Acidobacteriota bacterium]